MQALTLALRMKLPVFGSRREVSPRFTVSSAVESRDRVVKTTDATRFGLFIGFTVSSGVESRVILGPGPKVSGPNLLTTKTKI